MTSRYTIDLAKPSHEVPWGFRLQGGSEYGTALSIQRVFSGSPADGNLQRGDIVSKVNGNDVTNVTLVHAQELIKSAGNRVSLVIQRESLPVQDLHVSNQAPSFAHADHHQPQQHPAAGGAGSTQLPYYGQFQATNSFPAHPGSSGQHPAGVSNVKFQPMVHHDHHDPHPTQNFHRPAPEPQATAWQPSAPSQAPSHHHHPSPPPPPLPPSQSHPHHQQHYEEQQQEPSGDVDDEHLRPVKEIKSMFNQGGHPREGPSVARGSGGHQVKVISQQKKPQGATKYQPPSPAIKPAAASHVQSAKNPPVYQQRSSYNPLDFQGINPKSPIPPNRPPGLIQRGAVDLKPRGTSLDYQRPNHDPSHAVQSHPQSQFQAHHQPTITPQGNLDPLTDFYLHGLNAQSDIPDFSQSTISPYSGKILPQRSEGTIKTPSSAPKKKEFKADQSAVYRILQEEEQATKQRPQGPPTEGSGRAQQAAESGGQSGRLAELLEKDQAQLVPYHTGDQQDQLHHQHQQQQHQQIQQHHHYLQHQQHHQQQQQHQQQHQQQYHHAPQQKQLMTSTAHFVPSPSREQPQRHHNDYNDYYQGAGSHGSNYQQQQQHPHHHYQQQEQQQQQHHYPQHQHQPQQHHYQNWSQSHSVLPETDF